MLKKFKGVLVSVPGKVSLGLGVLAVAGSAAAQTGSTVDVSGVTPIIVAAGVAISTVFTAVLLVLYGKKAYTWLKPN